MMACTILARQSRTVTTYHMNKYELLGARRSASLQELKSKYQTKVRETHPDKQARHANDNLKAQAAKEFLLIQEAWEVLRDVELRREYDSRLDAQQAHVVVSDEVNTEDMEFDEADEGSYSHECRCGEAYVVTPAELREGFDVVGCLGCSLYIRVIGPSADDSKSKREGARQCESGDGDTAGPSAIAGRLT